tara:strand:+ start:37 stop:669 length:633 start_codon:yes stop_codon:yes gene_type:complete
MSWEDMLKKENKPTPDDISFMERMLNEVLSKVGSIYGLVPKQISNQNYEGFPAGYYYSPEAVVEYAFNVGFEENADGFVVDKTSGSGNPAKQGADWQNLWGYGFKDKIMNLPEEYRDMGSREDYPVYYYDIGAENYDRATIGIHVKKEDPQIESLVRDIHKKFEKKYGEGKTSSYEPMFSMAYSTEEDRNITPEEAMPKDDWKDSLRGNE